MENGRFASFETGRAGNEGVDIFYRYHLRDSQPTVLLVHGWPQHGLMWHTVAAALVRAGYSVIVPDQRGAGASDLPPAGYDEKTLAGDMVAVLDDLGLTSVHVFGYDLGAGTASALALHFPDRIISLVVAEFALPGFGYEEQMQPQQDWTVLSNWHLGLFCVPEAVVWLFAGREDALLDWFFGHLSFQGTSAVSNADFTVYHRAIRRPGALRAGAQYYAAVFQDRLDFATLNDSPLELPVLALGGVASSGPALKKIWSPIAKNLETYNIPNTGHWIGDENPRAVAHRLHQFLDAMK